MTSSFKLLAAFASVLLVGLSPARADHVYGLPVGRVSMNMVAGDAQIVDSIPQLGIIVMRSRLSKSAELSDLGEVGRVHLITPRIEPMALTIPSGLWGLKAISLGSAWNVSKGAGVVVAISDTGVSSQHPLLASQMWENPGETGTDSNGSSKSTNGIDDDGDGYIDDVYGWDFVNSKNSGTDHYFHGTHVAGTIAAAASSKMVGVAPSAKLMDVSFLDSKGTGTNINGAKSLVFAVDHGAKIINCSWGGGGSDRVLKKAIQYAQAHGVLVIAAAGNNAANDDKILFTPSGYSYSNIVSVGATADASGARASFSNFGHKTVDLAAPGQDIYSLAPNGGYATLSGTSMATPHVAGVAALVWSAHPSYSASQVKKALMSADGNIYWSGKSVTGGILNASRAVNY